jgi:opacity protein-like surface antigen
MQSKKLLAAAGFATVALASAAYAQSTTPNQYNVSGGTSIRGGTTAKPKAADLKFAFQLTAGTTVPQVVKTYTIKVEGGRVNWRILPGCASAKMDAAASDASCPTAAKVGSGTLKALIGSTGAAVADAQTCTLPFKIYNSGGGKAALWIKTEGGCPVPIAQSVPARWTQSGTTGGLTFTVPDLLRHQVGLDLPVVDAKATISKITKTVRGKKVGFLESTGCKDGKRDFSVQFTTDDGQSQTIKKTLPYC